MEKLEHLCIVGETAKWCRAVENNMAVPQKFSIELPYDPTISLMGTYTKESKAGLEEIYIHQCLYQLQGWGNFVSWA